MCHSKTRKRRSIWRPGGIEGTRRRCTDLLPGKPSWRPVSRYITGYHIGKTDMGLIRVIEVNTIPAGREEGLCSQSKTRHGRKTICIWRVIGVSCQAHMLYSLLRKA